MWHGCTPILEDEPGPFGREISGWIIPDIGEIDIESEGLRVSVLPRGETLHVELMFSDAFAESPSEPYRPLGAAILSLEGVLSIAVETSGTVAESVWKQALHGKSNDEVLRMTWDKENDVLRIREAGTAIVCQGGSWNWRVDTPS